MRTIVFESPLTKNFYPLTLTKPSFDLLSGTGQLLDRLERLVGPGIGVLVPEYLSKISEERHPGHPVNPQRCDGDCLFLSSLVNPYSGGVRNLLTSERRCAAFVKGDLVFAKAPAKIAQVMLESYDPSSLQVFGEGLEDLEKVALQDESMFRYPWAVVDGNAQAITRDCEDLPPSKNPDCAAGIMGPSSKLFVGEGADIESYVVLDTRKGPIVIGQRSVVESFSRISGPAFIGREVMVRSALIRSGATVGDFSRIAGEVDYSILGPYTNKSHEGFLGHSYVGEWVNLGAQTTTSDLKNTYGTVRLSIGTERVDTGMLKVGAFIGDGAKSSIGCMIYSGKRIGVCSQVHGLIERDIPSFTIFSKSASASLTELYLDSALETQKRMMKRRGLNHTSAYEEVLRRVFEMTAGEREASAVLKGLANP